MLLRKLFNLIVKSLISRFGVKRITGKVLPQLERAEVAIAETSENARKIEYGVRDLERMSQSIKEKVKIVQYESERVSESIRRAFPSRGAGANGEAEANGEPKEEN